MLASVIVFLISSATPTLDPELDALYQKLHAAPELSGREEKTAALLAEKMRKLGFTVTQKVEIGRASCRERG